jgi:hypothetical protein
MLENPKSPGYSPPRKRYVEMYRHHRLATSRLSTLARWLLSLEANSTAATHWHPTSALKEHARDAQKTREASVHAGDFLVEPSGIAPPTGLNLRFVGVR